MTKNKLQSLFDNKLYKYHWKLLLGPFCGNILRSSRSCCPEGLDKKRSLNNFTGNTCFGVTFLVKPQAEDLKHYLKKTSAQVFSWVNFETPSDVNCLIFSC